MPALGLNTGAPLRKWVQKDAPGYAFGFTATPSDLARAQPSAAEAKAGSIERLEKRGKGKMKAGGASPGEPSSGEQSPEEPTEPPLGPDVSLRLSAETVTLAAFALSLFALSCSVLPPLRIANLPLPDAVLLHILLTSNAIYLEWAALQSFKNGTATTGRLLTRHPGLPPDWHMLSDPKTQLGGLLQPVVTIGLYLSTVVTVYCFSRGLYGGQLGVGTSFFLSAAFLTLPQPLLLLVIALSSRPSFLNGIVAARCESALCVTLLISVLPGLFSTLGTIHRAAEARLPRCRLPWNCECFLRLLVALCPALSSRLHPYALRLDYARVALLPLPYSVPLPVPVPRWELLKSSWRALLYAAPMVLPLARLLAAAPMGLPARTFCTLVVWSRPVQISACVSAVTFLLGRQRAAYEVALEEKNKEEDAEVETLDKMLLQEFDSRMLDHT
ncbi:hypothetical protein KFL_001120250 [Klebsormidium nitens]|uniref:Transmembrane protein n=1 Tax=Klebsormidium nitens TaxID=105231 RepID=A0A1Y1HV25_KLENI|nr:hypothetical protein KFL_001120250 [Klebsormidium nitens]|eukprot:GAQ82480.1 hypothetical protein KFL_001120250 [Klebsormidium nitens]